MTSHALRATFLRVEATRSVWRRYAPGRQKALRATFLRVEATRSVQRRYAPGRQEALRATFLRVEGGTHASHRSVQRRYAPEDKIMPRLASGPHPTRRRSPTARHPPVGARH